MSLTRKCPNCGEKTVALITECKTNRRFCYNCAPDSVPISAITTARKMDEHHSAGTLDKYSHEERSADLRGERYEKPN
jgi:hypothetical protein